MVRPLLTALLGVALCLAGGTFDMASLYLPGGRPRGALGGRHRLGSARGARRNRRPHARPRDGRRGRALSAARRGAKRRPPATRRRAARAAARLAGADRGAVVAAPPDQRALLAAGPASARAGAARDPRPAAHVLAGAVRPRPRRGPGAPARGACHGARQRRLRGPAPTRDWARPPSLSGRRLDASAAELEIDGLRQYRDGAPASRIHWPSVARHGEILERRLVAELDSAPLVVLDPSNPAEEEALDKAVRAAASLVCGWRAGRLRHPAAGRPPPDRHRPRPRCLAGVHARLALVEEGPAPAGGVLGPRGGAVIWVTGADLRTTPRALERLPAGSRYVVAPGALPGIRPAFEVAGCTGCLVERVRRGVAA